MTGAQLIQTALKEPEPLFVSRWHCRKRSADRDAALMGRLGGKRITVKGKRGCWQVRGKLTLSALANFASVEAKRESK